MVAVKILLKTTELKHINILTKNIEASWKFYKDVLGVRYCYEFHSKKIVGKLNDFDFFIEEIPDLSPLHSSFHIGLRTTPENVYGWYEHLKNKGIQFVEGNNGKADIHAVKGTNRVALYFTDPDGTTIEIYSPE